MADKIYLVIVQEDRGTNKTNATRKKSKEKKGKVTLQVKNEPARKKKGAQQYLVEEETNEQYDYRPSVCDASVAIAKKEHNESLDFEKGWPKNPKSTVRSGTSSGHNNNILIESSFKPSVVLVDCGQELSVSGRFCANCKVLFPSCDALAQHSCLKSNLASPIKTESKTTGSGEIETFYECTFCEYKNKRRSRTTDHMIVHSSEKPNKCNFCPFATNRERTLQQHIRAKHTQELSYQCELCDRRFTTYYWLRKHLQRDHKQFKRIKTTAKVEELYECTLCQYKTTRKDRFPQHMTVHSGEKPFKCDFCSYASNRRSHLRQHIRTRHVKEPIYQCNFCDQGFVLNSTLKRHVLKAHVQEKNFQCEMCGFSFLTKAELMGHSRSHIGKKVYKCNLCDFKSVIMREVNRHMTTHMNNKLHESELADIDKNTNNYTTVISDHCYC